MTKPRIAVIGTGGTISSVGRHSLELAEYVNHKTIYTVDELLERIPEVDTVAEVVKVPFAAIASTAIGPNEWVALAVKIEEVIAADSTIAGVVVTHGTASLEETAYFLNLTLRVSVPVVIVGAQRPATAISADGPINLVNALRTAGSPAARGQGVLVVLNDEIQAAREVTKTSTLRMQTFRTPDFGVLGHADADNIMFYRAPVRRRAPNTEFIVSAGTTLPRVDIVYSYGGADGKDVDAFVAAGAKGIVAAGFAPGLLPPEQLAALSRASNAGIAVVQSSRVGSGRVVTLETMQPTDSIPADNLTPQKARVLLMLGLHQTTDRSELRRFFEEY
ncbi:MAG: asparaginase [Gammaproteobacteria bacterium]|nr:asparaginase [Gammaproteobacteria bacterium]